MSKFSWIVNKLLCRVKCENEFLIWIHRLHDLHWYSNSSPHFYVLYNFEQTSFFHHCKIQFMLTTQLSSINSFYCSFNWHSSHVCIQSRRYPQLNYHVNTLQIIRWCIFVVQRLTRNWTSMTISYVRTKNELCKIQFTEFDWI